MAFSSTPRPSHARLQHLLPHALARRGSLCLVLGELSHLPGSPSPKLLNACGFSSFGLVLKRFPSVAAQQVPPEWRRPVPEAGSRQSRQGAWPQTPRE